MSSARIIRKTLEGIVNKPRRILHALQTAPSTVLNGTLLGFAGGMFVGFYAGPMGAAIYYTLPENLAAFENFKKSNHDSNGYWKTPNGQEIQRSGNLLWIGLWGLSAGLGALAGFNHGVEKVMREQEERNNPQFRRG